MTDQSQWKPLIPSFNAAVRQYVRASRVRLQKMQNCYAVTAPLYHYTNKQGLEGIINSQQFWFTHYQHLNDDNELKFGLEVAKGVIAKVGTKYPKSRRFCEGIIELLSEENMNSTFEFYIASFSQNADSPNQWEKYAEKGQGFAIGIAPQLFAVENKPDRKPHENDFVVLMRYGRIAGQMLHLPAIECATRIISETVKRKAHGMRDIEIFMPLFREMGKNLIASELILNSLTLKNQDWALEQEVRLFIVGEINKLAPYKEKRYRNTEIVPYIKRDMPLWRNGNIVEIVIGSQAPTDAEDFAYSLLKPFHNDPRQIIRRSSVKSVR